MGKYKKVPENYFKFVHPVLVSIVGVGMYLMLMAWLDPKGISPTIFGRVAEFATWLGTENNHIMKQLSLCTAAIHISEAIVALYLCQKLKLNIGVTLAWVIQTLLLGIFSLRYLIWPQRQLKGSSGSSGKNNSTKNNSTKNNSTKNNSTKNNSAKNAPAKNSAKTKSKKEK